MSTSNKRIEIYTNDVFLTKNSKFDIYNDTKRSDIRQTYE